MGEIVYVKDINGNIIETEIRDEREERVKELEEEDKKLREELEHYKNTEAIQKSNNASRYKYPSTSYVDRELNVIN